MAKVADQEDPDLTSFHGHNEIATIYRTTIYESNPKNQQKRSATAKDINNESQQDEQERQIFFLIYNLLIVN